MSTNLDTRYRKLVGAANYKEPSVCIPFCCPNQNAHERIFVIEQNRDAQFRSLMMIGLGAAAAKLVSVHNGMPITADNIFRQIKGKTEKEI